MSDYVRLSPEALLDLQRAISEANKQSLHQQMEEQERIIQIRNRTTGGGLQEIGRK